MKRLFQRIKCFFGFHDYDDSFYGIDKNYHPILECQKCGKLKTLIIPRG